MNTGMQPNVQCLTQQHRVGRPLLSTWLLSMKAASAKKASYANAVLLQRQFQMTDEVSGTGQPLLLPVTYTHPGSSSVEAVMLGVLRALSIRDTYSTVCMHGLMSLQIGAVLTQLNH